MKLCLLISTQNRVWQWGNWGCWTKWAFVNVKDGGVSHSAARQNSPGSPKVWMRGISRVFAHSASGDTLSVLESSLCHLLGRSLVCSSLSGGIKSQCSHIQGKPGAQHWIPHPWIPLFSSQLMGTPVKSPGPNKTLVCPLLWWGGRKTINQFNEII